MGVYGGRGDIREVLVEILRRCEILALDLRTDSRSKLRAGP
jgi:hypothetical protein